LWKGEDAGFAGWYHDRPDPIAEVAGGCHLIVSPSASPFVMGKAGLHRDVLRAHAKRHRVYVASVNQSGANDDLIFDGHAVLIGPDGETIAAGGGFDDAMVVVDTDATRLGEVADPVATGEPEWLLYRALVSGVRDYVRKTGFPGALIGLSGGIDSALTAVIAAAALGAERVTGVSMPGVYSSDHSRTDAADLAERLGVRMVTLGIEPGRAGLTDTLDAGFAGLGLAALGSVNPDVTEQNLQSRVRGALIMAMSNRSGDIVLTTGNKSELAVGYCTLYGDMNGGLAVLSDVPKTWVYRLSRWINAEHARCGFARVPIPEGTITKPPSAELAPGQLDSDSLPGYDDLDAIIAAYVDQRRSVDGVIGATGVDGEVVRRMCRLIDRNEYKRHQAALGLKVTGVAFGRGRRMPIVGG
jgi:NAD+ synthetase